MMRSSQKVSLLKVSFDTAGPHEKGIEFKVGCCGADPATPVGLRCESREKDIGAGGQRARQEIAQLERFVPTEIEPRTGLHLLTNISGPPNARLRRGQCSSGVGNRLSSTLENTASRSQSS